MILNFFEKGKGILRECLLLDQFTDAKFMISRGINLVFQVIKIQAAQANCEFDHTQLRTILYDFSYTSSEQTGLIFNFVRFFIQSIRVETTFMLTCTIFHTKQAKNLDFAPSLYDFSYKFN